MKRVLSLFLIAVSLCSILSGCVGANNSAAVGELKNIPSMTLDEVAGSRLVASTNTEVESEIYNFVSDRIVVDGSKLIAVSGKDEVNITNLLANINTQLQGRGGNVLTDDYANYLLLEFAKTPFEWVQSNKDIKGFDPAARLYFVDVTYTTTDVYKSVVPDSKIPNGHPEGDRLKQKRYTDYIALLNLKTKNDLETYYAKLGEFTQAWGNLADIFNEQQGVSLYERTLQKGTETGGIGKLTYSGLVSDNTLAVGATMTIRYVLKYSLNLGEETDLAVEALYLKSYELKNQENILKNYNLTDTASLEVLKPFIDNLILSYNKCVEESNHIGLYNLFYDYGTIDKYYDEIRDYTYNSIGGYNYQVLERKNKGKEVAVKVSRVNQIRARGAEMSLPTYDEIWIFNIILGQNDNIFIKDCYLLKSDLIGEPLSVIKNVTGISEQIQYSDVAFSETNREKVEQLIKDFSQIVVNNDYSSADFLKYVDLGISQNTLNRMADTIKAITPTKKHTYIVSWDTKTNVYCSVTIREVFECGNGNFDTEAVLDMGNRNGEWKVVNYTRKMSIKTNSAVADTSNALCTTERTAVGGDITKIEGDTNKSEVSINNPVDRTEQTPNPLNPIVEPTLDPVVNDNTGDTPNVDVPNIDTPVSTPTPSEDNSSGNNEDDFS